MIVVLDSVSELKLHPRKARRCRYCIIGGFVYTNGKVCRIFFDAVVEPTEVFGRLKGGLRGLPAANGCSRLYDKKFVGAEA
ncbi:hypothetical protein GGU45_001610 [Niabella hirudinis]